MLRGYVWLRAQAPAYLLRPRQDLPPGAFIESPAVALRMLRSGKIAALSYKWLDLDHPDPHGFHIEKVRDFLLHKDGRNIEGVFWDFASVYQKPRKGDPKVPSLAELEPNEHAAFKRALKCQTSIYAHPKVLVIVHRELPPDFEGKKYDSSGWCIFEEKCAMLATRSGNKIYELAAREFVRSSVSKRLPPDEMGKKLEEVECRDQEVIAPQYQDLHEKDG